MDGLRHPVAGSVRLVPGARDLAGLHEKAIPQKDQLCGPFWGALTLSAAGHAVEQEEVALRSGTTLAEGDPSEWLPPGASPRTDYNLPLPVSPDEASAGTSAPGLARGVEELSGNTLKVIPVAGPWTAETVLSLVEISASEAPECTLVANLRTGRLWGSRPPSRLRWSGATGTRAGCSASARRPRPWPAGSKEPGSSCATGIMARPTGRRVDARRGARRVPARRRLRAFAGALGTGFGAGGEDRGRRWLGAGRPGAYPLRPYRGAQPVGLDRRPPSPARQGQRGARGSVGGRLAPALLPLRRDEHGREPLGRLPAHAAQARPLLARRRDGVAPHLLFRAGVRPGGPGVRAGSRLLLRGPAARRAVRAACP